MKIVLALLIFFFALPVVAQEEPPGWAAAERAEMRAEIDRLHSDVVNLRVALAESESKGVDWVQLGIFVTVIGGVVVSIITALKAMKIEKDVNSTTIELKSENKAILDIVKAENKNLQAELLKAARAAPATGPGAAPQEVTIVTAPGAGPQEVVIVAEEPVPVSVKEVL